MKKAFFLILIVLMLAIVIPATATADAKLTDYTALFGDSIYFITNEGGLSKLDVANGQQTPISSEKVQRMISIDEKNILFTIADLSYADNKTGRTMVYKLIRQPLDGTASSIIASDLTDVTQAVNKIVYYVTYPNSNTVHAINVETFSDSTLATLENASDIRLYSFPNQLYMRSRDALHVYDVASGKANAVTTPVPLDRLIMLENGLLAWLNPQDKLSFPNQESGLYLVNSDQTLKKVGDKGSFQLYTIGKAAYFVHREVASTISENGNIMAVNLETGKMAQLASYKRTDCVRLYEYEDKLYTMDLSGKVNRLSSSGSKKEVYKATTAAKRCEPVVSGDWLFMYDTSDRLGYAPQGLAEIKNIK